MQIDRSMRMFKDSTAANYYFFLWYLWEFNFHIDGVGWGSNNRCRHLLLVIFFMFLAEAIKESHARDVPFNSGQSEGKMSFNKIVNNRTLMKFCSFNTHRVFFWHLKIMILIKNYRLPISIIYSGIMVQWALALSAGLESPSCPTSAFTDMS